MKAKLGDIIPSKELLEAVDSNNGEWQAIDIDKHYACVLVVRKMGDGFSRPELEERIEKIVKAINMHDELVNILGQIRRLAYTGEVSKKIQYAIGDIASEAICKAKGEIT